MSYSDFLAQDRRLRILQLLARSPGYASNAVLIGTALEAVGHSASSDAIASDLAWLEEQGLVRRRAIADVVVASITPRGADVAQGKAEQPGVRRPRPGE